MFSVFTSSPICYLFLFWYLEPYSVLISDTFLFLTLHSRVNLQDWKVGRLGRWMEPCAKTSLGKTPLGRHLPGSLGVHVQPPPGVDGGASAGPCLGGSLSPCWLVSVTGWSLAALWAVLLCVAGPENQSQQSPGREEVSAARQPEEASGGQEKPWTSQKDFQVLIKPVGPPRTLGPNLWNSWQWSFYLSVDPGCCETNKLFQSFSSH